MEKALCLFAILLISNSLFCQVEDVTVLYSKSPNANGDARNRAFFVTGDVAEALKYEDKKGKKGSFKLMTDYVDGIDQKLIIRINEGFIRPEDNYIETVGTKNYFEAWEKDLVDGEVWGYRISVLSASRQRPPAINSAVEEKAFLDYLESLRKP